MGIVNNDDDIYPQYCKHNNPIWYTDCPGCRIEFQKLRDKRYEEYMRRKGRFNPFTLLFEQDEPEEEVEEFAPLKRSNSQEELKKSFYKLSRIYHPDKGGDTSMFQKLNSLYQKMKFKFNI